MAVRKQVNPYAKRAAQLVKTIAKTKPSRLHAPLFELFVIVAATGDAERAGQLLDWMYGRTPAPTEIANALSTQAIDGFCAASNLGDRTKGLPNRNGLDAPLAQRVARAGIEVFNRITADAYGGKPQKTMPGSTRKSLGEPMTVGAASKHWLQRERTIRHLNESLASWPTLMMMLAAPATATNSHSVWTSHFETSKRRSPKHG
jgi:hypothetical protein